MASETVKAKTCVSCKAVSETGEGYIEGPLEPGYYCPRCYQKRATRKAKWSLVWIPLLMGFLWLLTRVTPPRDAMMLWACLNFYLTVLFQFAVVLPHELGHALSARLLGLRVYRISAGIGPELWTGRLLGGRIEIRRYPFGGYTVALDDREPGFRLRRWIHIACGPLVNAVLIAAVLPFVPHPFRWSTMGQGFDPVKAFLIANACTLFFNLLPRRTRSSLGPGKTDGLHLLTIPFSSRDEVRRQLALTYALPAGEALEARRNDDAIRIFREGLQKYPESLLLRHDLAVALLNQDRHEESRQEFLALAEDPKFDPRLRLLCLNNIAAADVMSGNPDLLAEADRCSAEAMKSLAWNPRIKGARAAVLVELGRFDEGIAMARESLSQLEKKEPRGWSLMTLAIAYKRKGDEAEGRKLFEEAVQAGATGARMKRVRALYESPKLAQ